MKKISAICMILFLLGLFSHPGCDDESDDNDKLLLLLLWQSQKYYLSFEADGVPVRMRVQHPVDYYPSEGWYQGIFVNSSSDEAAIKLPGSTSGPLPITYDNNTADFRFTYDRDGTDYGTYPSHSFTFNITEWDGPGGEITAIFSGVISDNGLPEDTINITNGELSARITN
jgi:hypothetical protein